MFNFEKLKVYQESLVFVDKVYTFTKDFPKDELYGLTSQLQRAAVSIPLNIAEGSSRSKKDFAHFLDIARGSCYEYASILSIVKMRKYIHVTTYELLYENASMLAKMISGLKKSIIT